MTDTVLNFQEIVEEWAWREYAKTASRSQKKLLEKERLKPKNYLGIKVDWSDVKFSDVTKWPRIDQEKFHEEDEPRLGDITDNNLKPEDGGKTKVSVLFSTKYTNDTTDIQEYTMRTEKTTRPSCETTLETSWTKGMEMSVGLKTPCEILEANAGYHSENSLTNTEGQTFEEEVTWGVESVIKVKPGHVADAQLVVNEKKFTGKFEITSKIRGTVFVTFTKVKDNNSFVRMTGGDISDIVQRHLDMKKRVNQAPDFVTVDDGIISVVTKGNCQFRYGVKQSVMVHQEAISKI